MCVGVADEQLTERECHFNRPSTKTDKKRKFSILFAFVPSYSETNQHPTQIKLIK